MKKYLAVGIILLFVGTCIIPAIAQDTKKPLPASRGNWLYVGGSGPGNYSKIQDAVDNASDGDTVYVYDDSSPYYEFLIINKSISLIGENKDTTIIKGYNNIEQHIIQINANGIHLHGFTIQNSTFVSDHAISYYGISISSNNNDISGNILTYTAGGILTTHASRNTIHENIITNGTFYCQVIRVIQGWNNDIFNNSISGVGFGVVIYDSAFNKIHGNSLRKIKYDGMSITKSLPWYNTMCNKIYKNYFSGAENGILLLDWCCFNHIFLNEITNCSKYGLERRDTFFVFIRENNFMNNSCNAYFFSNGIMNQWSRNYWGDWNGSGYYTIKGEALNLMDWEGEPIPVEQYDKHPAQEPNDITGMR
jgi:parallel beta-helix repeat protein